MSAKKKPTTITCAKCGQQFLVTPPSSKFGIGAMMPRHFCVRMHPSAKVERKVEGGHS